jgi:cell division protein FtsW (lipid II flippase)
MLLLPLTPFGRSINGSRLWIQVAGFSFQPGRSPS